MMSVTWLDYNDTKILYIDYRDCKNEEDLLQTLALLEKMVRGTSLEIEIPMLFNYEGVPITMGFMNRVKELGKEAAKSKRLSRQVVIGMTGLKSILLQSYLRATGETRTQVFRTEQEGLAWLTRQK